MPPHRFPIAGSWRGRSVKFRPDRLVVGVKPGYPVAATLAAVAGAAETALGVSIQYVLKPGRRWALLRFNAPSNATMAIAHIAEQLELDDRIQYAEPSVVGRAHTTPADVDLAKQKWPAVVDMATAWGFTTGNDRVLLAIMDSGISMSGDPADPSKPLALDHPDLNNARFILEHGGVKNDYVDDPVVEPSDQNTEGHGTHVTGIAAATANNVDGRVAGVNWACPVYIARVIDELGNFDSGALKDAVTDLLDYAAGVYECVVVNMSLGTEEDLASIRDMCDRVAAFPGKVLFVCASGGLVGSHTAVDYPAGYANLPGNTITYDFVVSVGSTQNLNTTSADPIGTESVYLPARDNYDAITIFAPGYLTHSTLPMYEREVEKDGEVIARSTANGYGESGGTSHAAPVVSGVATLMWALNDGLTAAEIIALLRDTADTFVCRETLRDSSGTITGGQDANHIRINAGRALGAAVPSVEIDDAHVMISNVEVGDSDEAAVTFRIGTACTLTFEVTNTPPDGDPIKVQLAAPVYTPDMPDAGELFAPVIVKYVPTAVGDIAYGEFKVKCIEACREWTIFVTASAVTNEGTAVVFVADRSGSMAQPSGLENLSRMDLLQEAGGIVADVMRVKDGLGVVGFSSSASTAVAVTDIAGEEPTSPERATIKGHINGLVPGGGTSIGAGVELSAGILAGASRPVRGMIVMTDGHENEAPFISDIMGSVGVPVYAIGMGAAEVIRPDALDALTTATGGMLALTDTLEDGQSRYLVAKYALQMLAGVTGAELVLDPSTILRPEQRLDVPFPLCSDDRTCEVTVLTTWPELVNVKVHSPRGFVIPDAGEGIRRIAGKRVICHRLRLPYERAHNGMWSASISFKDKLAEETLKDRTHGMRLAFPGMPCSVIVTSRSSLRMICGVSTTSNRPGGVVRLSTRITRRGRSYDSQVRVVATVVKRGENPFTFPLEPTGPGRFEGTFRAASSGVYQCVIRATGMIPGGERFSREQTLTAQAWPELVTDADRARRRETGSDS